MENNMKKIRRLPNGKFTNSTDYYLRSWKKVAREIVKKTGWTLVGFDPDFIFVSQDQRFISLPLWAVEDLKKLK